MPRLHTCVYNNAEVPRWSAQLQGGEEVAVLPQGTLQRQGRVAQESTAPWLYIRAMVQREDKGSLRGPQECCKADAQSTKR